MLKGMEEVVSGRTPGHEQAVSGPGVILERTRVDLDGD